MKTTLFERIVTIIACILLVIGAVGILIDVGVIKW